jgi:hypothetical protein
MWFCTHPITAILMTFATLELRLVNAGLRICKFLQTIQQMYRLTPPDLVSVLLTCSSVQSEYGLEAPRIELAELLARPDYGAAWTQFIQKCTHSLSKMPAFPLRIFITGICQEQPKLTTLCSLLPLHLKVSPPRFQCRLAH